MSASDSARAERAVAFLEHATAALWSRARGLVLQGLVVRGEEAEQRDLELTDVLTREEEATDAADAVRAEARSAGEPLPIDVFGERYGLDPFEEQVLLLAAALGSDLSFGDLLAHLREDPLRGALDVDLALTVLTDSFAERIRRRRHFLPSGALVWSGLLTVDQGSGESGDPLLTATLKVPERVLEQLTGERAADARADLPDGLREPDAALPDLVLPRDTLEQLAAIAAMHGRRDERPYWAGLTPSPRGDAATVLLHGPSGTGKTLAAHALAYGMGRPILPVDDAALNAGRGGLAQRVRGLFERAEVHDAVLLFDGCERWFGHRQPGDGTLHALLAGLDRYRGTAVFTTDLPDALDEALDRHILYKITLEMPQAELREELWRRHVPGDVPMSDDVDFAYLARKFDFAGGFIKNAVMVATGLVATRSPDERALTMGDLMLGARTQLRHRLTRYAERTLTQMRLGDLILPEEVRSQIGDVIEAVKARHRVFHEWGFAEKLSTGRGLSVLFDGEAGTGKTLCAEIIASELGLTLYRINVANIVDKYIGETEKNLTKIFKEARATQSLLLFDEADSLFAKRVDVKSSNDRFANMEVNVLLQLIERYEGLVVLTTNLKHGIDKAFERRLSYKIHFPFPDPEHREAIWRLLIPPNAPVENDLRLDLIADAFELSGGSIKNSLVRAAYRAAAEDRPIAIHDIQEAAKRECAATGRLYRVIDPEDLY